MALLSGDTVDGTTIPRQYGPALPDDWRRVFLTRLEQHGTYHIAARAAGVSVKTIERYRAADPDFNAACLEARQYAAELYEEALIASADRSDNPVGYIVRLKQLKPAEYIERHAVLNLNVTTELSEDHAMPLLAAMLQSLSPHAAALLQEAAQPALPPYDAQPDVLDVSPDPSTTPVSHSLSQVPATPRDPPTPARRKRGRPRKTVAP